MSTRHIARTLALQTLFELDVKDSLIFEEGAIDSVLERNRDEFGQGIKDVSFAKGIITNVLSRKITVDDIITRAAPDWPLEKIGTVDRNVLRIGLSELLFGDRVQVPPKVAIDEAIELAKAYGGETSGKFVNGVLGAIYKEMGEPDKEQKTKSRNDGDVTSLLKETLVGALVYKIEAGEVFIALVHDVFGYWTLPKGHLHKDDTEESALSREIKKEIGVDIVSFEKIAENEYIANKPEIGKVIKHVGYYIAKTEQEELQLEKKGGLDDAKWFSVQDIKNLRMYNDMHPIISKGIFAIEKHVHSS